MNNIRVALVENLERVHRVYRRILEQTEGVVLVGSFFAPEELLTALDEGCRVDVVVMDIRMDEGLRTTNVPRLDGIEAARLLRQRDSRMAIVLYTMWDNPEFYRRVEAIHFRSHYALVKRYALDVERLGEIIRTVFRGFTYIDPEIRAEMDLNRAWSDHSPLHLLENEDQRKVLALLSDGLSNDEIALALGVKQRRVEDHISTIYELLCLNSSGTSDTRRIRAARMYLEDRVIAWESQSDKQVLLLAQDMCNTWRALDEVKYEERQLLEDNKIINNALV